jgi:hypothetical protein
LEDLSRLSEILQLRQCCGKDVFVPALLARTAEGATHRMVDKNGAWRWNSGQDIENRADDEGRYPPALDHMGDETDGLVTKRSVGYQQGKVNAGLL